MKHLNANHCILIAEQSTMNLFPINAPEHCCVTALETASVLCDCRIAGLQLVCTYLLIAILFGFLKGNIVQGQGNYASTQPSV